MENDETVLPSPKRRYPVSLFSFSLSNLVEVSDSIEQLGGQDYRGEVASAQFRSIEMASLE